MAIFQIELGNSESVLVLFVSRYFANIYVKKTLNREYQEGAYVNTGRSGTDLILWYWLRSASKSCTTVD